MFALKFKLVQMKKILIIVFAFGLMASCSKEDDGNTGPNATNPPANNSNDTTAIFFNSYQFSDDGVVCYPLSNNIGISFGILSVVSQPCSKPSSKLDGYFRFGGTSLVGTYNVVGRIGDVPVISNMNPNESSMLFYNHGESTLYALSGTIEITKNSSDTTLLDVNWKDMIMGYEHDSSTVKFSGNFTGI